jgi:hypothetical protein
MRFVGSSFEQSIRWLAIHRGVGSIDLTGAVRLEMIAGSAANDLNDRAMVPVKNNLGPDAESLAYEIVGE